MNQAQKATHVCKIEACITSAIWILFSDEGMKIVRKGYTIILIWIENNVFSSKDIYFDNIQIVFR